MQVDPTYARRRETASELVQGGSAWSARAPCLRVFERDPGGIPSLGRQFWRRLDWPVDRSCLKTGLDGTPAAGGA